MAEVRLIKFSGGQLAQLAQASDSVRVLSLGVGVAGIPASGIVDANVGVNLAGSAALSFSATTLTLGGTPWTTAVKVVAGSGGNVTLSPSGTDTWTLTNVSNVVTEQLVSTATSASYKQATLASGTAAALTISAQSSSAVGSGGALNLQSGSGAATNGVITLQPGGAACLSLSKSGAVVGLSIDSAVSSFSTSYSATSAGVGGSISITAQDGAASSAGGAISVTAGAGSAPGSGGALTLASGSGITPGTVSLQTGSTVRLLLDASSNIVTTGAAAGVVGGMVGGLSIGTVTTTPTSSAVNQAQIWNKAGVFVHMGWSGSEFFVPPTGQGSGAPVRIGTFGLGGERSDGSNTSPEVFIEFEDAGGSTAPQPLTVSNSGSGALAATAGLASHPGIRNLTTGATAISSCCISTGSAAGQSRIISADDWVFETEVQIPTLSVTGTQEFAVFAGWGDNQLGGIPTNGCFFTYTLNGGSTFWRFGGTGTGSVAVANSTVTVTAGSWYRLRIVKVGGTITFYVNGTSVGTNATACTAAVSAQLKIISAAGTNSKVVSVDYMKWSSQFSTAR